MRIEFIESILFGNSFIATETFDEVKLLYLEESYNVSDDIIHQLLTQFRNSSISVSPSHNSTVSYQPNVLNNIYKLLHDTSNHFDVISYIKSYISHPKYGVNNDIKIKQTVKLQVSTKLKKFHIFDINGEFRLLGKTVEHDNNGFYFIEQEQKFYYGTSYVLIRDDKQSYLLDHPCYSTKKIGYYIYIDDGDIIKQIPSHKSIDTLTKLFRTKPTLFQKIALKFPTV